MVLAFVILSTVNIPFGFRILLGISAGIGTSYLFDRSAKGKNVDYFMGAEPEYLNVILALVGQLIKIDGTNSNLELKYVDLILDRNFDPSYSKELKKEFREIIQKNYKVEAICGTINNEFDAGAKIQVIQFLCAVATCDAFLSDSEYRFILGISQKIGIPFKTFRAILAMFNYRTQRDREEHKKSFKDKKKVYSRSSSLKKAFELLELNEDASNKEIKQAYRKMAKKHHPDRVLNMGKEFQKMAKERFQKIQEAYELIKDKRGFS